MTQDQDQLARLKREAQELRTRLEALHSSEAKLRAAQQALRQQEKLFRAVIESLPFDFFLIGSDGRYAMQNSACRQHWGDIVGLRPQDLPMADERTKALWADHNRRAFAGELVQGEVSFPVGGELRYFHNVISPVRDNGGVCGVLGIHIDITDRKQAEQALHDSEEKYRRVSENIPVAVYSALPDEWSTHLLVSGRIEEMTGYPGREFLEDRGLWGRTVHPADRERLWREIYEHRRRGGPLDVEYRILTRSGQVKWIRNRAAPCLDERGRIARIDGFMEDITERKAAEEQIRLLSSFPEQDPNPVFRVSAEGVVTFANPAGRSLLAPWRCSVGLPVPDQIGKELSAALAAGGPREVELDLGDRTYLTTFVPGDRGAHLYVYARDITERRQAERDLRQQAQFLQTLLDSIPNPVYYKGPDGRYMGCNQAFATLVGAAKEQVAGKSVHELAPQDLADKFRQMDLDLLAQPPGTPQTYEGLVQVPDGTRRDVVFHKASFADADGKLGGIVGVVVDLTERKRGEERLRTSHQVLRALGARLERAREEERTALSRRIHDDIGHALAAIAMDLAWLRKHLAPDSAPIATRTLRRRVKGMTQLLEETIQTVRDTASELRPGVLDDLGLVAALEWQARQFQQRTGIACRFSSALGEQPVDRDRATALFRICQGMLTNVALHAGAAAVEVHLRVEGGELMLGVRDNGVGITEEQVASLSSLGILGMRERTLSLGGRLDITGAPGQGTTASVRVPLGDAGA